ncbi:hypothetical protein B0H14DRAFT_731403 [Mycena olivaceomarginata]|nr:hypothetical protein B0H14DRAFT_731403 [Mycena olivaceomarginata]
MIPCLFDMFTVDRSSILGFVTDGKMITSRPISPGARRCLGPLYIFMATIQLDAATLEEDLRLGRAFFLAGLTVICCDYLLTLDLEVTHIWNAPLKRSSAWFVLVRYFALIGNLALIPYFFGNFDEELSKVFRSGGRSLDNSGVLCGSYTRASGVRHLWVQSKSLRPAGHCWNRRRNIEYLVGDSHGIQLRCGHNRSSQLLCHHSQSAGDS